MWFMPYYIIVLFLNQFIFCLICKLADDADKAVLNYVGILLLLIILQNFGSYFVSIFDGTTLFYSFFWSVGVIYKRMNIKITKKQLTGGILAIMTGILFSSSILDISVNPLQDNKFPPNLTYLLASFIVILFAIFMKNYYKKPWKCLVHIGKNSIWYFFAQGIGSSLLYWILNYIRIKLWFPKWLICFLINFFITIIIAEGLRFIYCKVQAMYKKLRENLHLIRRI